ncbi:MAG: hypothetical protein HY654_12270 [Acidobacteria bacterium]|nr:hypothetical protein [Acidobacteriota bacterium]
MTLMQRLLLVVCAIGWTGCATLTAREPQRVNPQAAALKEFDDRVKEFRQLHDKLAAQLNDPIRETADAAKLAAGEKRLTVALRQARQHAKQGDLFTPAVAPIFREIVTRFYEGGNPKLETAPQDRPPAFSPKINASWPMAIPVPTTPPTLLAALPKLPEDLAYRFVDRTLVLMDVDTDLILDYLPYASRPTK